MAKSIIYTRSGCPYCESAVELFESLDAELEVVNLDGDPARRAALTARYKWRTVPMIVVGERFLGGYSDVARLHDEDGLEPLIRA